tara:strand:+ start:334 stop:966 length:633 start_codon:yes stop_codon:yes gene_type:complete
MYRQAIQSYLSKGFSIENPYIMTCDLETTGFSEKKHDMISFSAKICDLNLDIKDEVTVYAKPKKERWTQAACDHGHRIQLQEALTFPDPRKTAIQLLHFIKPFKSEKNAPILFVSHDTSGFDSRFLKAFFMNQMLIESYWKVFQDDYRLSTIHMARRLGVELEDNKLPTWAKKLGLELNHHEVKSDTDVCFAVFKYILENSNVQQRMEIT